MKQALTIFTCSIYPDVTRIWFYCLKKVLKGENIPIVIYDSSGLLKTEYFPGATLIRFPNVQHGTKIDHFIKHNLKTDLFFLCDDDAFLLSTEPIDYALKWLQQDPKNAIVSLKPRLWWIIKVGDQEYPTMGSYALFVKSSLIKKHGLSFEAKKTDRPEIRNGSGYYDTADYINEYFAKEGYPISIAPEELRNKVPTFFGTSSAMMAYYTKRWFSKQRKRRSAEEIKTMMLRDTTALQRAISIAFVSRIHASLFSESMIYCDFLTMENIESIVRESGNLEYETLFADTTKSFEVIEASILNI